MSRAQFRDTVILRGTNGLLRVHDFDPAEVYLFDVGSGNLISEPIYADDSSTTTLPNPMPAGPDGLVDFWLAEERELDVEVVHDGYTTLRVTVTTDSAITLPATGPTGNAGPPGPAGPVGPPGNTGAQGAPGGQGPAGPAGPVGGVGPQGVPGPVGGTGATGAAGQSFSWAGTWVSTSAYAPNQALYYGGSSYMCVGVVGPGGNNPSADPTHWQLMAAASQASQGAPGPAGPPGPAGSVGPAGAPGSPGAPGAQGDPGPAGPVGPAGSQGSQGVAGPAGSQGVQGVPGSVWFEGAGAPATATGTNGDWYLNTTTGDVYQKISNAWTLQGNIMGPAGSTGPAGATGPAGGVGPPGQGVPAGGTAGQVLAKVDATNYNTVWQTAPTWPLLAPNGTPAAPSYAFAANPSDGIYRTTLPSVNIIEGGSGGEVIVSGRLAVAHSANAYYDGTTWQRWDTGTASTLVNFTSAGVQFIGGTVAGGTSWSQVASLSSPSGDFNTIGKVTAGPALGSQAGDMGANRGDGSGVIFLGDNGHYVYWSGTTYVMPGGPLSVNGGNITASGDVHATNLYTTGGVAATGAILSGGNYFYFAGNAAFWNWDGTYIRASTHVLLNGTGSNFYFTGGGGAAGGAIIEWLATGYWLGQYGSGLITNGNQWYFNNNGGNVLTMNGSWTLQPGNLNVPNGQCSIGGSFFAQGTGGSYAFTTANSPTAAGQGYANAWISASSRDFKQNIAPIGNPLGILLNPDLRGVEYDHDWELPEIAGEENQILRAAISGTKHNIGFIADDWLPHVPEIVAVDDSGKAEGMDYARVTALLWEALREYITSTNARLDQAGI